MCRPRGFFVQWGSLEEEIGHCVSSPGTVIQGAAAGSARHVAAGSEGSARRAGCLLQVNAPSAANSDSFAVNHFQKWTATVFLEWTLWNPSLIMAGFQLVVLSEFLKIKTKPLLERKESTLDRESKSISSLRRKNCHRRPAYLYWETQRPCTCLNVCEFSARTAGCWWFPTQKVANDKKGSLQWVGGRVRWWRLRQCSWSRVVDSKDC